MLNDLDGAHGHKVVGLLFARSVQRALDSFPTKLVRVGLQRLLVQGRRELKHDSIPVHFRLDDLNHIERIAHFSLPGRHFAAKVRKLRIARPLDERWLYILNGYDWQFKLGLWGIDQMRGLCCKVVFPSYSRRPLCRFSSASFRYIAEMSLIKVARLA